MGYPSWPPQWYTSFVTLFLHLLRRFTLTIFNRPCNAIYSVLHLWHLKDRGLELPTLVTSFHQVIKKKVTHTEYAISSKFQALTATRLDLLFTKQFLSSILGGGAQSCSLRKGFVLLSFCSYFGVMFEGSCCMMVLKVVCSVCMFYFPVSEIPY